MQEQMLGCKKCAYLRQSIRSADCDNHPYLRRRFLLREARARQR
jgi:hypothetical protein